MASLNLRLASSSFPSSKNFSASAILAALLFVSILLCLVLHGQIGAIEDKNRSDVVFYQHFELLDSVGNQQFQTFVLDQLVGDAVRALVEPAVRVYGHGAAAEVPYVLFLLNRLDAWQ